MSGGREIRITPEEALSSDHTSSWHGDERFAPHNAFDRNTLSYWKNQPSRSERNYLVVDVGAPKSLKGYALQGTAEDCLFAPSDWILSGSHDLVSWVTVDARSANHIRDGSLCAKAFVVSDMRKHRSYRYYRIEATTKTTAQLSEFQLFEHAAECTFAAADYHHVENWQSHDVATSCDNVVDVCDKTNKARPESGHFVMEGHTQWLHTYGSISDDKRTWSPPVNKNAVSHVNAVNPKAIWMEGHGVGLSRTLTGDFYVVLKVFAHSHLGGGMLYGKDVSATSWTGGEGKYGKDACGVNGTGFSGAHWCQSAAYTGGYPIPVVYDGDPGGLAHHARIKEHRRSVTWLKFRRHGNTLTQQ